MAAPLAPRSCQHSVKADAIHLLRRTRWPESFDANAGTWRGETDDDAVNAIREHMRTDHPALLETVGREDLLGWIQVE